MTKLWLSNRSFADSGELQLDRDYLPQLVSSPKFSDEQEFVLTAFFIAE